MDSLLWERQVNMPQFPALKEDIHVDVAIIGGGITGLLCAYFLQDENIDYVLVEGRTICSGVTKNTTAKITAQHGLIYHKLLNSMGKEKAFLYLKANLEAIRMYSTMSREMDCDFEWKENYVYSLDNRKSLEQEADALARLGFPVIWTDETELPLAVAGAVGFKKQAQFHPLKFLAEIAKNLHIYEHTFVKEIKKNRLVTERGNITCDKMIVATHFPVDNKHGLYFMKMYQHRSYVLALKQAAHYQGMYIDGSKMGFSFRNYEDYLLLGGGSHRTGKEGGCWEELQSFAKKHYPASLESCRWATQDCISLDDIPYIGQYSMNTPGVYTATGFNKWGMTSAMTAAGMLRDLVLDRENPYTELFSPSRNMLKPRLLSNSFESAKNLLSFSTKRCAHLGCALKWNRQEHSWDCPCHGSRFMEDGTLINNPANRNL